MSRSYAVKETFYTLQGEGYHTGRAAVFLRFAGCNLWSGRQEDRERGPGGCSRWCDTDFVGTDGSGGGKFLTPRSLADHVVCQWMRGSFNLSRCFVVCTGGEPLLQLDAPLIDALHDHGFEVAIETNGTLPVPAGIDWVCVSPKDGGDLVVTKGDELKLVVSQVGTRSSDVRYDAVPALLAATDGRTSARRERGGSDQLLPRASTLAVEPSGAQDHRNRVVRRGQGRVG